MSSNINSKPKFTTQLNLILLVALFTGGLASLIMGICFKEKATLFLKSGEAVSTAHFTNFNFLIRDTTGAMESYSLDVDDQGNLANLDQLNKGIKSPIKIKALVGLETAKTAAVAVSSNATPSANGGANSSAVAVALNLKSEMFDQNLDLSYPTQAETRLGPILFRLVAGSTGAVAPSVGQEPPTNVGGAANPHKAPGRILIVDGKSGEKLQELLVDDFIKSGAKVKDIDIKLSRRFEQAVVVNNKMDEGGTPGANPALELQVSKGSEKLREIVYAAHEEFSLHPDGAFGLRFKYLTGAGDKKAAIIPAEQPTAASTTSRVASVISGAAADVPEGHYVEINIGTADQGQAEVALYKDKALIKKQILKQGQSIDTPWMKMVMTLRQLTAGVASETISESAHGVSPSSEHADAVAPSQPMLQLASSHMADQDQKFDLMMGAEQAMEIGGKPYHLQLQQSGLTLPFSVIWQDDKSVRVAATELNKLIDLGSCSAVGAYNLEPLKMADGRVKVILSRREPNWLIGMGILSLISVLVLLLVNRQDFLARKL